MAEWKHTTTVGICRLCSNSVFRFQLCFANFISLSSFRLWVFVPEDCMCITVQGALFLVVGFPFQSIASSLGVGFFNSVQFGVSIQFCSVSGSQFLFLFSFR